MNIIIQPLAWLAGSVVAMSFIEHQVHQNMMHKKTRLLGRVPAFKKMFEHHTILHHAHYHDIFADEAVAPGEDRGIRLSVKEGFFEALPFGAVIALFSLQGAVIFVSVVCLHHFLWGKIHLEMHKPEGRWFSNWPLFKFLARHHYLHHRYPARNFNVVFPIADYFLRTNVRASAADLSDMRQLGMFAAVPITASADRPSREDAVAPGKKR